MSKTKVIVHRCKKSLSREVSIRCCNPYKMVSGIPKYGDKRWWLLKHDHNFDDDSHYLRPITPIEFCPFCGKGLIQYSN